MFSFWGLGQNALCFVVVSPTGWEPCSEHFTLLPFEAFLLNEDLGDSLDSVEALLKKHEDFEKSLSAQEEKITVRAFLLLPQDTLKEAEASEPST